MSDETKAHRVLRLILFLSSSYAKTRDECTSFLSVRDTAFYSYCNLLKEIGFNLFQKEGRYRIDYSEGDTEILRNVLHFSEEESYILSRIIDHIDEETGVEERLKKKLVAFFNQEKSVENYIIREKSIKVQLLQKALKQKKQALLVNYSSGNSETIRNRFVEPFEFKDDFNMVWAFDIELKQNRQFKVCRIQEVIESPLNWEYERQHKSRPVDIFRNTGDMDKNISLLLRLRARNLLIEEYPLAERYLKHIKENLFELNAPVSKYEGPARFVLGLPESIKIVGDDRFRDFFEMRLKKVMALRETRSQSNKI